MSSSLDRTAGIHALAILDQTEPLDGEALARLIEQAAKANMWAIEIPFGPDWLTASPEAIAESASEWDMAIAFCMFHLKKDPLDGGAGEAATIKEFEQALTQLAAIKKAGASVIGVTGPEFIQIGKPYETADGVTPLQRAVAFASIRIAPIAKQTGIDVFVEALCAAEDGVINTSRNLLTLLEGIGCERFKAHLDTFHLDLNGENPVEAMQVLGERLGYLHASGRKRDLVSVGIDWKAIRKGLECAPNCKWIIGEALGATTREKLGLIAGSHGLADAADAGVFMKDLEQTLVDAFIIEP
jgi:sugar phosphate isomerase/epimerase